MNNRHSLFFSIVIFAIMIKLSLFAFAATTAPQGKLLPDSHGYLKLSDTLASKGVFAAQDGNGSLIYETFRTPGYPIFLAIFHSLMKIPLDGIIFIQIAMTLLAAFITYKTALQIDQKIAFLSAVIILFDPPVTIFSLTILTESLFLLLISLFMFVFTLYLKATVQTPRGLHDSRAHLSVPYYYLTISALVLAAATYVRPVSYYLGFAVTFFIIYVNGKQDFKKAFAHAMIFGLIVYSLVGIWQIRNYARCHDAAFCSAERSNLSSCGLFKSYARNTDPYTKGMAPLPYYVNVSVRSLMSLMTRPGNFKYFQCEPLNLGSFIFSYPWMIFWLSGFVWGVIKVTRDTVTAQPLKAYLQFMLFVILYFSIASIGGLMWSVSERLRVPMMPFIAIISAYGWVDLRRHCEESRRRRDDKAISKRGS